VKKLIVMLVVVLVALPIAAQSDKKPDSKLLWDVVAKEKALWDAWAKKDGKVFEEWIAPDAVAIDAVGGIMSDKMKTIEMVTTHNCVVNNYSFSDERLTTLSKDVVLLTFKANQDVSCDGQKVPANIYVSSVWKKQGGKWWNAFHQETPALLPAGKPE
jgi:hypothetical protein